jgi:hypothetical protein
MLGKLLDYESKEYIEHEIAFLKKKLSETDYQAIKFAEGWISAEEYEKTKKYRQALRDQINSLEDLL